MYKRKARVVFVSFAAPRVAVLAHGFAQRLGCSWIEPQAATVDEVPGRCAPSTSAGVARSAEPQVLDDRLLHWADLLVCLDEEAWRLHGGAAAQARSVYWPDVARLSCDGADDAALRKALTARIVGMIGGMRLLASSDEQRG